MVIMYWIIIACGLVDYMTAFKEVWGVTQERYCDSHDRTTQKL